jgi:hypothetical protein
MSERNRMVTLRIGPPSYLRDPRVATNPEWIGRRDRGRKPTSEELRALVERLKGKL